LKLHEGLEETSTLLLFPPVLDTFPYVRNQAIIGQRLPAEIQKESSN